MKLRRILAICAVIFLACFVVGYAAATYPGGVKSFTTKSTNDTIQASHINDLQDEVMAIEQALLSTGFAHHLRTAVTNTYDVGVIGATFRDLNLGRNALIGGTFGVTGATTLAAVTATTGAFSSTLGVTGVATFTAQSVHNAGIDLSGASSGQIVFPATQNASSGVNTLDDYEEGAWTPSVGGGTSESGQVYSFQAGRYTKVGRLVQVRGRITLSTLGTITGDVQIEGLPFAAQATSGNYGTCQLPYFAALSNAEIVIQGLIAPNASVVTLTELASAQTSVGALAQGDLSATTDLIIACTYEAAN